MMQDIFPVMGVEHQCILSRMGDITLAYEAILPPLFSVSDQEYTTLHHSLTKAISVLPKHTVFHKQDRFVRSAWRPGHARTGSFLARCSDRFFDGRPLLDHRCVILLTRQPLHRNLGSSLCSSLVKRSIVPQQAISREALHDFCDCAAQFARILCDSGLVSLRRLTDGELAGTHEHSGIIEQYCTLQFDGRPVVRDMSFDNDIRIGEFHCELYTLADVQHLPSLCGPRINYDRYSTDNSKFPVGFAASLGQLLHCNHIYNQYVFIGDAARTIRHLERKRLRLQSLSAYSRENNLARQATDEYLDEAVSAQQLPVKASYNLLVWSEDRETLRNVRNQVSAALAQMDAVVKMESVGAPQIYWAGIPGNEADFPVNETFDTFAAQAACLLNMESGYPPNASSGIRLGDRLTGVPLTVDLSDEPVTRGICTNRNKFILGPSGSGKSFFTNHLVRSYHEQGAHIVLVDVGHSYQGLCQLVHGYYFTFSEAQPIRFNPFYLPAGTVPDTEKKESIKTLLLALWKKEDESFKRAEYVALSNALQLYYQFLAGHPELFPCFNSFYEFLQGTFREALQQEEVDEKDFDMSNFLYVLRPFYRGGEYDYLLNATENLDLLHERFIVFELDNIKDHPILLPVVTIVIMEVFISKMRRLKGVRKMILIEEAWKAIAREGMAEYIRYLFKTVRKYFGEAIVVTQDVEDIISSPVVKQAIIHNSDCKILLDQRKYQNKFDQIQELLGLTEKEKTLVLSINRANEPGKKYKEVFISLGGVLSHVYRAEVSPEEYYAYTTEESEKLMVHESAGRWGGNIERGITALVRKATVTDQ